MAKIHRTLTLIPALTLILAQPALADTAISDIVSVNGSYISSTGPDSTVYTGGEILVISGDEAYLEGSSGASGSLKNTTVTSETGPLGNTASSGSTAVSSATTLTIPAGLAQPEISSEAAILVDAATGEVLYEKNADERLAPASTTKLLTALLMVENLSEGSTISFSSTAVNNLESGAATVSMSVGDTMTFKDALSAIMIRSACEVANAVAETISGSQSAFAALMNSRLSELGCTGSHFVNASGLNDDDHYSTVRDMAVIAQAALSNDLIASTSLIRSYELPATSSRSAITISSTNKFVTGDASIDGYLGGKTGYTSKAGQCLASKIKVGGRDLIAVVFKAATGYQYTDTEALVDYGAKIIAANSSGAAAGDTSLTGSFVNTADGVKYLNPDGTYLTSQWLDLDGKTYFFGSDSLMCTGWVHFSNGDWYYFASDGSMVTSSWVIQDGKSYYMQANGVMAVSTIVNGKYEVDENGVYFRDVA